MTALVVDACVWVSAADSTDNYHAESRRFLREATKRDPRFLVPAFARVEIACALARRLRDEAKARALTAAMLATPLISEKSVDRRLLAAALDVGVRLRLRGADALYAAVAELAGCRLATWDGELLERAGAGRPSDLV